ncbi:MAG: hypothetical protein DRH34_08060 [Deltaproteobacteria bacterium]|nr:MAG: hypothetical protein DRH34_08060 [Deltaproteobacteria bacterium]RLC20478.1 MAG: hypothetical protein DRH93_13600 [Deltaproteobacteria bacterium]HGY11967.1 hypothetical protein [Desulfobacterales bacterium]
MNPFAVLSIKKEASNKEIIHAAALGMRSRQYSAKEIAQAQKMLLDPVSRACQEFLHFIDLSDTKERLIQKITEKSEYPDTPETSDCPQLQCLNVFEKKS